MKKKICLKLLIFIAIFSLPLCVFANILSSSNDGVFVFTKKIEFEEFPNAFNPSIIKIDEGFLFSFRYAPDYPNLWINEIVVVVLNDSLQPISTPQILHLRKDNSSYPYYEDCRLFSHNGKIFILYADFTDSTYPYDRNFNPFNSSKEEMHVVELFFENNSFRCKTPTKLIYKNKYYTQRRQKNWVPFEYDKQLLLSYYIFPHEVLFPDLITGECKCKHLTDSFSNWNWGQIRGGTPAILIEDEYLAFFHSSTLLKCKASKKIKPHFFTGAYTFSSKPPFEIKKISPTPLIADDMYTYTDYPLNVIFPGGYAVVDEDIYLAYGKNDSELWIAKMSKKNLLKSLIPISKNGNSFHLK